MRHCESSFVSMAGRGYGKDLDGDLIESLCWCAKMGDGMLYWEGRNGSNAETMETGIRIDPWGTCQVLCVLRKWILVGRRQVMAMGLTSIACTNSGGRFSRAGGKWFGAPSGMAGSKSKSDEPPGIGSAVSPDSVYVALRWTIETRLDAVLSSRLK